MKTQMYLATNENIVAIKSGMSPKKQSHIYSIAASFDIPFMFLENGARVMAVDNNQLQINYGNSRIKSLEEGDLDSFRSLGRGGRIFRENYRVRDKYFSEIDCQKVKDNLGSLEVRVGDFFDMDLNYSSFNSVYLSNAIDYILAGKKEVKPFINSFFEKFNSGTEFYLTSFYHDDIFKDIDSVVKEEGKSNFLTEMDSCWDIITLRKK